MDFITTSHRNAEILFSYDQKYTHLYDEVVDAIRSITDEDIIKEYEGAKSEEDKNQKMKSISVAINSLLRERLIVKGWKSESPIFEDVVYNDEKEKRWRLDFAKKEISIEVAFNHGEAIAWNLLKPVMASELNHVKKAIQTSAGIVICATERMKKAGNFDGAVGTYEKFLRYLKPMYNVLTSPLLIIGLMPPTSFRVDKKTKEIVRL